MTDEIKAKLTLPPNAHDPERRASKRYASGRLASCRAMPGVDAIPVQIKDVSAQGVSLGTPRRFELGTMLILELHAARHKSVSVFAQVVRVAAHGRGQWMVGCSLFEEMAGMELEAFRTAPASGSGMEPNASVRLPDKIIAVCRRASGGTLSQWAAEVRALSPAGMGLLVAWGFEVGAQLKVNLPAQDQQPAATVFVRVVRRERQADAKWLLDCETYQPAPDANAPGWLVTPPPRSLGRV